MDVLVTRHLDAAEAAHDAADNAAGSAERDVRRDARTSRKFKKLCRTDPDASCH
jgi:hypothetical protein